MLEEIDEKKKAIEEKRPLSKNTLKSIREKIFQSGYIIQMRLKEIH